MNLFRKLVEPRLPGAAVGLSAEGAGVVSLERRRGTFAVRRAGFVPLAEGLVRPHFDEPNLRDAGELAEALAELATSAGLGGRRRWSAALPEESTRASIVTLENAPATRGELEEVLKWKTERAFGAPPGELRVARRRLGADASGRARYLLAAVRLSVLAEYEAVFAALGWQTGLILPRHLGEAWWLMRDGAASAAPDSLLVSAHAGGFTAVLLRRGQPLLLRNVHCEREECRDELYRFLLFYRDRLAGGGATQHAGGEGAGDAPASYAGESVGRLLVTGSGLDAETAGEIVRDTLDAPPRFVRAEDLNLAFPSGQLDFAQLAAPAGLAALKWS